jgi:hypothetical protein
LDVTKNANLAVENFWRSSREQGQIIRNMQREQILAQLLSENAAAASAASAGYIMAT